MRSGKNARVGGQSAGAPQRSRRPLVLRVAIFASASMVLLGVVAGCVQSPIANPGLLAFTDADSTSQAYTPDSVPFVVPGLGGAPDVLTPSGDAATPTADPGDSGDPGAVPTMEVPAATKAAGTSAPGQVPAQAATVQPQATQAVTTAAPATTVPTTAQATAAKTTTAANTQALVGPGAVELKCTHTSDGKSKAVLKWTTSGFNASVTVNGRTTYLTNTTLKSLTAYAEETVSGHGICTGRVGDSPAANSY